MAQTNPYRRRLTTTSADDYARALDAEPNLRAVDRLVTALCAFVRPSDVMCSDCLYGRTVDPLVTPLVGWERGAGVRVARDPEPDAPRLRVFTIAELDARVMPRGSRPPATTDTERWMRTADAYDAVRDTLLARLWDADPGNGHGVGRATRRQTT